MSTVDNPINRYLLKSTMLEDFVRDDDGGFMLFIQHNSPGKDKGPFSATMRLYWPKAEALDGT